MQALDVCIMSQMYYVPEEVKLLAYTSKPILECADVVRDPLTRSKIRAIELCPEQCIMINKKSGVAHSLTVYLRREISYSSGLRKLEGQPPTVFLDRDSPFVGIALSNSYTNHLFNTGVKF